MKIKCKKCLKYKESFYFRKDSSRQTGLHPYCKQCNVIRERKRRRKNNILGWKEKRRKLNIKKTRICNKCHIKKKLKFFGNANFKQYVNGKKYTCKDCERIVNKARYHSSNKLVSFKEKHRNNKIYLVKMKGGKCQKCGIKLSRKYPSICFDFHHVHPKHKKLSVGEMIARNMNILKIIKELSNCLLVCANCHRKIHLNTRRSVNES